MTVTETQDQTVQPGEEEVKAGDVNEDAVDTATTGEGTVDDGAGLQTEKPEEFSIEDIMSDAPQSEAKEGKEINQDAVNKRIDKVVGEKKAAENRADVAERKVAELEAEKQAPKERPMVPDRDNYDTFEDYQKDYDRYQDDTIAYNKAQVGVETQEIDRVNRDKVNAERLVDQVGELKARYPDVVEIIQGTNYGNARQAITDSSHNARIGLFLAKNETERIRIGSLTDQAAINREIGKLEARFDNVKTKTTNAPTPLETIDGQTDTVVKDISKIKDDNNWYKARKAEEERKLKQGHG